MKRPLATVLLLSCLGAAAPAHAAVAAANAAVVYDFFSNGEGSFSYTADDFIGGNTKVSGSAANCSSAQNFRTCVSIEFINDALFDRLNFSATSPLGIQSTPLFFEPTAFNKVGTFLDESGGATLRVSLAPGAVPEPATWAMMIVGFGAVGRAMRRRRKATTRVSHAV